MCFQVARSVSRSCPIRRPYARNLACAVVHYPQPAARAARGMPMVLGQTVAELQWATYLDGPESAILGGQIWKKEYDTGYRNFRESLRFHALDLSSHLRAFRDQFGDRKSTRLNSSHLGISYAVFCLKKKKKTITLTNAIVTTTS